MHCIFKNVENILGVSPIKNRGQAVRYIFFVPKKDAASILHALRKRSGRTVYLRNSSSVGFTVRLFEVFSICMALLKPSMVSGNIRSLTDCFKMRVDSE